jgi:dTDP-glucose 4,6-dehydratase
MIKVLVTGTAGFIFSNFIRQVIPSNPNYQFVGVDKLVKEYNINNLYTSNPAYNFYLADIADSHTIDRIFQLEKPNIVIGGAAESFVDNSITDVMPFLHSNIIGTQTIINACLKHKVDKYVHISSDEIYGQQLNQSDRPWIESDPLQPRNPYATSKAAAELIVNSAHITHGLQYQITRSCNVFGARQKRENLIPHIIHALHQGTPIRIHGNGLNFRQYIYVHDEVNAIMAIIKRGKINQVYNIGDNNYFSNLEMVNNIANIMNKHPDITFIEDRKAHDFGYSVNTNKIRELGWKPKSNFKDNLNKTVYGIING